MSYVINPKIKYNYGGDSIVVYNNIYYVVQAEDEVVPTYESGVSSIPPTQLTQVSDSLLPSQPEPQHVFTCTPSGIKQVYNKNIRCIYMYFLAAKIAF